MRAGWVRAGIGATVVALGGGGVALATSPMTGWIETSSGSPTTPATSVSTSTLPPTTTTTAPPVALPPVLAPEGIGRGARAPDVQAYEQRLADLRYDPGAIDGLFDGATVYAVQAFQKVRGLERTGKITDDVRRAMEPATFPQPLVADTFGGTRVEIDLVRQVLFLWKDGALRLISTVSTGNGRRYCVDGACDRAVTPGGEFAFTWHFNGWRTSKLGKLYNPVYFNKGIAIHGSLSVPVQPASHGCVRIPMHIARYFPTLVEKGDAVHVLFGEHASVPFDEQAPAEIIRTTTPPTVPPTQPSTTVPSPETATTIPAPTETTAPSSPPPS